jgi:hypothetical protein
LGVALDEGHPAWSLTQFGYEPVDFSGSPMAEVLHKNLAQIEASDIHARLGLEKG